MCYLLHPLQERKVEIVFVAMPNEQYEVRRDESWVPGSGCRESSGEVQSSSRIYC